MNPLQGQNLLSELRDIHLPDNIAFELAWGYWVLIVILVVVAIVASTIYLKKLKNKKFKREINAQLQILFEQNAQNLALQVSIYLRRYARYRYPETKVETLSEYEWVNFLDEKKPMNEELKQLLAYSAYEKTPQTNIKALRHYAKDWIEHV